METKTNTVVVRFVINDIDKGNMPQVVEVEVPFSENFYKAAREKLPKVVGNDHFTIQFWTVK